MHGGPYIYEYNGRGVQIFPIYEPGGRGPKFVVTAHARVVTATIGWVWTRTVYHLELPSSVEEYVQETGRCGRDGRHTTAVLYPVKGTLLTHITVHKQDL